MTSFTDRGFFLLHTPAAPAPAAAAADAAITANPPPAIVQVIFIKQTENEKGIRYR